MDKAHSTIILSLDDNVLQKSVHENNNDRSLGRTRDALYDEKSDEPFVFEAMLYAFRVEE